MMSSCVCCADCFRLFVFGASVSVVVQFDFVFGRQKQKTVLDFFSCGHLGTDALSFDTRHTTCMQCSVSICSYGENENFFFGVLTEQTMYRVSCWLLEFDPVRWWFCGFAQNFACTLLRSSGAWWSWAMCAHTRNKLADDDGMAVSRARHTIKQ